MKIFLKHYIKLLGKTIGAIAVATAVLLALKWFFIAVGVPLSMVFLPIIGIAILGIIGSLAYNEMEIEKMRKSLDKDLDKTIARWKIK